MRGTVVCFLVCGVALTAPAGAQKTPAAMDPIAPFAVAFEGKWKIQVTLPG